MGNEKDPVSKSEQRIIFSSDQSLALGHLLSFTSCPPNHFDYFFSLTSPTPSLHPSILTLAHLRTSTISFHSLPRFTLTRLLCSHPPPLLPLTWAVPSHSHPASHSLAALPPTHLDYARLLCRRAGVLQPPIQPDTDDTILVARVRRGAVAGG